MRLLVVQYDISATENLCAIAAKAGHEVAAVATTAASAIAFLEQGGVDLALLDLKLDDGMRGFEVARAAERLGVPSLIVTGRLGLLFEDLAGAAGVVAKPYDEASLVAAISFVESALANGPINHPPRGLILSLEWIDRLGLGGSRPPRRSGAFEIAC